MTYLMLLILVFVTIVAASPLIQDDTGDLTEDTECERQLMVCKDELHELRKQRERVIAALRKKVFEFRFPDLEGQRLENEIKVLNHQLYHPYDTMPSLGLWLYVRKIYCCRDVEISGRNCTESMTICESNKTKERERIASYEGHIVKHNQYFEETARANIQLRETAHRLRTELSARNMTALPEANYAPDFDENWRNRSPSEYDIDSEEVERRVAASIVTPTPSTEI